MTDNLSNKKANLLINETSPYLLQHAYNPVDWHPWNKSSLEEAKKEDKLLIISVGYAACHWCHVMEHESFEDSVVAVKMNSNYVPIKVDREERPDVDQIYMNAAHLITGRGGWPLNAIALPDGRPIFAGTYFPKDKWIQVLDYFAGLYQTDRARLEEQANQLVAGIRNADIVPFNPEPALFTEEMLDDIWGDWEDRIDYLNGGRQGAPKFMMPNNWEYLLQYFNLSKNGRVLEGIEVTLKKMADGGLYDHAGGGFSRYSTDAIWQVPHFEKMLYDNGQLVSLYAHAYQLNKDPYYKQIVEETLTFIEREMLDKSHGFYSSLDADSEGEEGKFYVWTANELKDIWGDNYEVLSEYFTIKENGNWEHQNILYKTKETKHFLAKFEKTNEELSQIIKLGKAQVMKVREGRIRPGLDDKILTSWNALMMKGYVDAYRAFDRSHYLDMAIKNAEFLINKCKQKGGRLNRNFKNGRSTINGFLDDYSLTIEAFIALYQATFDEKWLEEASNLMEYAIDHFYDNESKLFYYTSDQDDPLISRSKEISDNVISSSNSSMGKALYFLGLYYYNDQYVEMAKQMVNNVKSQILKNGPFFANWASLMTYCIHEPFEIAIMGKDMNQIRKEFDQYYLPNAIFLGADDDSNLKLLDNKLIKGQTTIYVCRDKSCKLPVTDVNAALELMK